MSITRLSCFPESSGGSTNNAMKPPIGRSRVDSGSGRSVDGVQWLATHTQLFKDIRAGSPMLHFDETGVWDPDRKVGPSFLALTLLTRVIRHHWQTARHLTHSHAHACTCTHTQVSRSICKCCDEIMKLFFTWLTISVLQPSDAVITEYYIPINLTIDCITSTTDFGCNNAFYQ